MNWMWVTGEPWDYENWDQNEPNDLEGEDCLTLYGPDHDDAGEWNDLDCEASVDAFVCECCIDEPAVPALGQGGLINLIISLIVVGTVALSIRRSVRLKPAR